MASVTMDYIESPEAQAEADRISLALHDLAHAVRHDPAEMREHLSKARQLTDELDAIYNRIG